MKGEEGGHWRGGEGGQGPTRGGWHWESPIADRGHLLQEVYVRAIVEPQLSL